MEDSAVGGDSAVGDVGGLPARRPLCTVGDAVSDATCRRDVLWGNRGRLQPTGRLPADLSMSRRWIRADPTCLSPQTDDEPIRNTPPGVPTDALPAEPAIAPHRWLSTYRAAVTEVSSVSDASPVPSPFEPSPARETSDSSFDAVSEAAESAGSSSGPFWYCSSIFGKAV